MYRERKIYRRYLLLFLIITMIPTLIIAFTVYFIGTRQIEKEVYYNHVWKTQQVIHNTNEQFLQLELTVGQFSIHPLFGNELKYLDLILDYNYIYDLYRSLLVMKGTNPLIHKVVLYSGVHQAVISELGIEKSVDPDLLKFLQQQLHNERSFFWSERPQQFGTSAFEKMLVLKLPVNIDSYGLIIVLLDSKKVESLIQESLTSAQDFTLVFENERLIAYGGDEEGKLSTWGTLAHQKNEQSGIQSINGEKYSVAYADLSRLNETWVYMTATPLSRLSQPIKLISKWIVTISITCISLAIILAWLASLRIYKPIDRLLHKLHSRRNNLDSDNKEEHGNLNEFDYIIHRWEAITHKNNVIEQKLEESLPELREGFFLQFLNGHLYSLTESELNSRLIQLGWQIEGNQFSVMVVMLTGLPSLHTPFAKGDEQLLSFAATNIIDELTRKNFNQSYTINNQDSTVSVLVTHSEGKTHEQMKQELFQLSNQIIHVIRTVIKTRITVSYGRITSQVAMIPSEMEQACAQLKYRGVGVSDQILDAENYLLTATSAYYPIEIEKEIIRAINLWKGEEATNLLQTFWDDMEVHSHTEYELVLNMQMLLGSIKHAILQSGFHPYDLYKRINLFEELNLLQGKEQIIEWFSEVVIRPYIEAINESKSEQKKAIVGKVLAIIAKEYMNDISLEQCAEQVGVLPYALSKMFKQITGTTYVVYVTRLKIEKSKDLLTGSSLMLNEIANEFRWHPSYFNKLFKKYEGLTPGEYRKQYFS